MPPTSIWRPGKTATAAVHYGVTDGLATTPASVSWTVTGTNDPPVAGNDTFSTTAGTPLTIPVAQLLANDSDVDNGDQLSITAVGDGNGGSVSLDAGVVTFTPSIGNGTGGFTYTVQDTQGASALGQVRRRRHRAARSGRRLRHLQQHGERLVGE